jgi:diaminohydroxyphosphoribosylaminopyrimidine deaminase/5-amino-6-(5-phosphoribosylamino)uracil reductase
VNDEIDRMYMRRAIALAAQATGKTSPNPCVGCVIVLNGTVIGEGWHKKAGSAHAEVNALLMAGANAAGATAYVSLEPCNHYGRTPPCTHALIRYTCRILRPKMNMIKMRSVDHYVHLLTEPFPL